MEMSKFVWTMVDIFNKVGSSAVEGFAIDFWVIMPIAFAIILAVVLWATRDTVVYSEENSICESNKELVTEVES